MQLFETINDYKSIAIIGMCKNAGKTSVLNYFIKEYSESCVLGLTSVGRDGESIDLVTNTPKPQIYIYKDTLIATAASMLKTCTATVEVLQSCEIYTPLGEVVVCKAKSGGYIELAGPSTANGLLKVRDILSFLGAEKVFIDGAFSRKSPGSAKVAQAIVLATGAAYDKNIDTVIDYTSFICQTLLLPYVKDFENKITDTTKNAAFDKNGNAIDICEKSLNDILKDKDIACVYLAGALTDDVLLVAKDKTLIIEDFSKMLATLKTFEAYSSAIKVLKPIKLSAVTINPTSPYGYCFDKNEFADKMQAAVLVPVFNIMKD